MDKRIQNNAYIQDQLFCFCWLVKSFITSFTVGNFCLLTSKPIFSILLTASSTHRFKKKLQNPEKIRRESGKREMDYILKCKICNGITFQKAEKSRTPEKFEKIRSPVENPVRKLCSSYLYASFSTFFVQIC